jgi:prepilin-type N-terminal cleavage/methylation domain-containing protein
MPPSRRAFTIIELLIVLAISALFSTLAIVYSSVGRNAVALTVEESKISQFILQAKQLSITTYGAGDSISCGFGVTFNLAATPQTYSIFSYDPSSSPPCPPVDAISTISSGEEKQYTGGTWQVPVSQGVVLKSQDHDDGLVTILFYPPDPTVFLLRNGDTDDTFGSDTGIPPSSATVYLETVDAANSNSFSVNSEGQISF